MIHTSILIPTRDHADLLLKATNGLLNNTESQSFEIVIVDNGSRDPEALSLLDRLSQDPRVQVVQDSGVFNFSRLNNTAAALAEGHLLLLLNNDVEIVDSDWLIKIEAHFKEPTTGIVGIRLLYGNGNIQHAGIEFGPWKYAHLRFKGLPGSHPHAPPDALIISKMDAVAGACLAIRKDLYMSLGGLDEGFPSSFNDIDLCFRVRQAGFDVVYDGTVCMMHHEALSRGVASTLRERAIERDDAERLWAKHSEWVDETILFNDASRTGGWLY